MHQKKQTISDLWPVKPTLFLMPGNTALPITFSGSEGADNLLLFYQHCCPLLTVRE